MERTPANTKEEESRVLKYNRILQGINRIFSNVIQAKTEEEVGNTCLSVALEITDSQYGFVGKVGLDGQLYDIAISDMGWEQCTMYNRIEHRRPPRCFILHGLYGHLIGSGKWDNIIYAGKGFFTNDPQSHPYSIGAPQDHPPIRSFLGVPLIENGRMTGILAVANREDGYSDEQLKDLQAIAPAVTQAIKRKEVEISLLDAYEQIQTQSDELQMQSEELQKANEKLEEKVKERTVEIEEAYHLLKKSEENLAEAQRIAHIGSWEWDIATGKVYWSDEIYRIFGLDPQEYDANYDLFFKHVHPDDHNRVNDAVIKALNGEPYSIDYRIISNNEGRTVHSDGEVIFYKEIFPIRFKGTTQDITERKRVEESLKKQAALIDLSPDAIIARQLDGTIGFWSKGSESLYGWTSQEAIGQKIHTLLKTWFPQPLEHIVEQVQQTGRWSGELIHCTKDGRQVAVQSRWQAEFDDNGNARDMLESNVDVTERKKAEEALAKVEIVRKQEIHHRIKNNLQVISSILDLQSEKFNKRECIKDSEVKEAFRESQDRVISMALIHEELYKGGEIDTLNFSNYIGELADNLFLTYRLGNEGIGLDTSIEEDLFFDMDTAVPLGMIINELISNSLKHAFPDRDNGEIRIKLHREENGECEMRDCKNTCFTLTVSDNGIGIPEDIDIGDIDSLGLQFVTTLTEQLGGELKLKRNNGTEFIIKFSVTGNNDQELAPSQLQLADND